MKCVICAIAKNENRYIAEWLRYHINLGFYHIFLYDNNDLDGERIEWILTPDLIPYVTIFDIRGKKYMQKIVYNECYYSCEFDWCAFIDIDEFITFTTDSNLKTITEFLYDKNEYDAVHLNWKCYGDSGLCKFQDSSVVNRFKEPIEPIDFKCIYDFPENNHVKSIVKSGLSINWNFAHFESNPHTPWGLNHICDEKGDLLSINAPFKLYTYDKAYIRHYVTKTLEEYAIKIMRQCADTSAVFYSFSKFYRYNKLTFRKLVCQHNLLKKYNIKGYKNSLLGTIHYYFKYHYPTSFRFIKKFFVQ